MQALQPSGMRKKSPVTQPSENLQAWLQRAGQGHGPVLYKAPRMPLKPFAAQGFSGAHQCSPLIP
jgi:hypothetical protein